MPKLWPKLQQEFSLKLLSNDFGKFFGQTSKCHQQAVAGVALPHKDDDKDSGDDIAVTS